MSYTCFEPEGSSSGRELYVEAGYNLFACNGISSFACVTVCSKLVEDVLKLKY
jgi:hypothetical protein